jgi:hypothetical protein
MPHTESAFEGFTGGVNVERSRRWGGGKRGLTLGAVLEALALAAGGVGPGGDAASFTVVSGAGSCGTSTAGATVRALAVVLLALPSM